MVSDEDRDLLAREMSGVRPIKQNKADIKSGKVEVPEFTLRLRRRQATVENSINVDGLSDSHLVAVAPEEYIEHLRPGLQHKKLQKLRMGQLEIQYNLDLHGFTFDDARDMLQRFISFCRKNHYTTVRIVHGKSRGSWEQQATMKTYVNAWLKQVPGVLGFASCLPVDGGTGAVYVLLSRPR
ncbi:Smr/MutS family protein [Parendozoicomonas haliclonae]|uniref:Putative DNA endonuclease SmrA n=1 Tax=Parendozoicomonas haliclonae TaxID=1960125 RepID=A0A1X7AKK8_9GAMM|nr:Smr/MutS family protein [Parendozoicomonas haliclonae]SMA47424.1 putative DNA endonuclease SmrA [Parendozoicomonas haliclonae]